jgi:hypothetical protein
LGKDLQSKGEEESMTGLVVEGDIERRRTALDTNTRTHTNEEEMRDQMRIGSVIERIEALGSRHNPPLLFWYLLCARTTSQSIGSLPRKWKYHHRPSPSLVPLLPSILLLFFGLYPLVKTKCLLPNPYITLSTRLSI